MIDYDNYHTEGYTAWTLDEFLSANELAEFNEQSDHICNIPINDSTYSYVYCVFGKHNDPDWPFKIPASTVVNQKARASEAGLRVTQSWYESHNTQPAYYRSFIKKFIRNFYPEIKEDCSNLHFQDSFTVYEEGDFSNAHQDGKNQGRLCVVLIYLTDKSQYNNSGGELVITGNDQFEPDDHSPIRVLPVRGNVAMLDFAQHNPFHGVEPVKEGFHRHCYLAFLWNTDKMPDNIRPKGY